MMVITGQNLKTMVIQQETTASTIVIDQQQQQSQRTGINSTDFNITRIIVFVFCSPFLGLVLLNLFQRSSTRVSGEIRR